MNRVGQVIQMDGTGQTTCLIVGRRDYESGWDDLWEWEIVVLDHMPTGAHVGDPPVHKPGDRMSLNNQYIEKYSVSVT